LWFARIRKGIANIPQGHDFNIPQGFLSQHSVPMQEHLTNPAPIRAQQAIMEAPRAQHYPQMQQQQQQQQLRAALLTMSTPMAPVMSQTNSPAVSQASAASLVPPGPGSSEDKLRLVFYIFHFMYLLAGNVLKVFSLTHSFQDSGAKLSGNTVPKRASRPDHHYHESSSCAEIIRQ
jgi:hypothetical protein